MIMENLVYYLSVFNSSLPLYMGHVFQNWSRSYNADGPGVVLSRASIEVLRRSFKKGHCQPHYLHADSSLGQCLSELGIQVC